MSETLPFHVLLSLTVTFELRLTVYLTLIKEEKIKILSIFTRVIRTYSMYKKIYTKILARSVRTSRPMFHSVLNISHVHLYQVLWLCIPPGDSCILGSKRLIHENSTFRNTKLAITGKYFRLWESELRTIKHEWI